MSDAPERCPHNEIRRMIETIPEPIGDPVYGNKPHPVWRCADCGLGFMDSQEVAVRIGKAINDRAPAVSEGTVPDELVERVRVMQERGRVRKAAEWQWGDVEDLCRELIDALDGEKAGE